MKNLSKVYRKLMNAESEYQAFLLYERLSIEDQKSLEEICINNGIMFFFFRHSKTFKRKEAAI
jgi:hypothetical protein